MKITTNTRVAAAVLGALLLTGAAGASISAAEESHGESAVDVTVDVQPLTEPGALALTVAGTSSTLIEEGSTSLIRQFKGTLPTVTVTDTRTTEEIPDSAFWYVLGTATDFASQTGQQAIGAEFFGWTPRLQNADEGSVSAGDQVFSSVDTSEDPDNKGLVDGELFAMASNSDAIAHEGQWTATADLSLRIPATVAAGSYASTLTLSLFE